MDLESLINRRSVKRSYEDHFVGREREAEFFEKWLRHHKERVNVGRKLAQQFIETSEPRQNVVHFYGIGGVGKTELSERLFDRISTQKKAPQNWSPRSVDIHRYVACTYDFYELYNPSVTGLLITLRTCLSAVSSSMPGFDFLLARYWAQNHPESDFEAYLSRRSQVVSAADESIRDQIAVSIEQLATEFAGFAITGNTLARTVNGIGKTVISAWRRRTHLKDFALFDDLFLATADVKSLPFYGLALAWDLFSRDKHAFGTIPVCFIDHVECCNEFQERQLQQMIWSMPNVLFVLSGRNRLDWGDADNKRDLFRKGPNAWPHLDATRNETSSQFNLTNLSQENSVQFLKVALPENNLDQTSYEKVAQSTSGYPYHLELIAQHGWAVKAKDAITLEDLLGTFPEIAKRVLRDLSLEEQRAVFVACLFDNFDQELLGNTLDDEFEVVGDLLAKPLVRVSRRQKIPFSIDRSVRDILFEVHGSGEKTLSDSALKKYAERAIYEINRRGNDDRVSFLSWCRQALKIAVTFSITNEVVFEIAETATSMSNWESRWRIEPISKSMPAYSDADLAVHCANAVSCIVSRQLRPRSVVAAQLQEILAQVSKDDMRFNFARYFLAEALRDLGQLQQASEILDRIAESDAAQRIPALHARTHILRRQGRFREIGELLSDLEVAPKIERLRGDFQWPHGRLERAIHHYSNAERAARDRNDLGEKQLSAAFKTWLLSISLHSEAAASHKTAVKMYTAPNMSFADILLRISQAILDSTENQFATEAFEEIKAEAARLNQTSLLMYADFSTFILHLKGNHINTKACLENLANSCRTANASYFIEVANALYSGTPKKLQNACDWAYGDVYACWKREVGL